MPDCLRLCFVLEMFMPPCYGLDILARLDLCFDSICLEALQSNRDLAEA